MKRNHLTLYTSIAAIIIMAGFNLLTKQSSTIAASPQVSASPGYYPVTHVVDGDTLDVTMDGKKVRIRVIGIDTPEVVDPRKVVQCFGKEASAEGKTLLTNHTVKLAADPTQDDHDKYGRLLRYVYIDNGTFYNDYMIREGYAHEYTYDKPYQQQVQFRADEASARQANRGLWNPTTCNGDTKQAAH